MTQQTSEDVHEMELLGDPLRILPLQCVATFPGLHQQASSLTPLEKVQLGLLMTATAPQTVVETGVWHGRTTRFLSEFMTLNQIPGKVYGFDLPEVIDDLVAADSFFDSVDNVVFIRGRLPESLSTWLKKQNAMVDLAIVDAEHSYSATYSDWYHST